MISRFIHPPLFVGVAIAALLIFVGLRSHGVFRSNIDQQAQKQLSAHKFDGSRPGYRAYVDPATGERLKKSKYDSSRLRAPEKGGQRGFDVQRMPNGSLKLNMKRGQQPREYYRDGADRTPSDANTPDRMMRSRQTPGTH